MNKYRIGTDIPFRVQIAEGDNAFDWADITVKQVAMYSDSRQAFAGACTHEVNGDDSTWLDCIYPASVQVLTGALRLVVIFEMDGRTLTYDLADVFALVGESAEADSDGDTVTSANITVSGLPISVISEILNACIAATAAANDSVIEEITYTPSTADGGDNILTIKQAGSAAQSFTIKNGSKGSTGDTGATGADGQDGEVGSVSTGEPGTEAAVENVGTSNAAVLNFTIPQGEKGDTGDTGDTGAAGADGVGIASVVQTTTSTESGGTNVITVTKTDGTSSTFQVKNGAQGATGATGATGPQGEQGNSGYTGAAGELEVVNNLSGGGATAALSAEMGKVLQNNIDALKVIEVNEDGFYVVDGSYNIGLKLTDNFYANPYGDRGSRYAGKRLSILGDSISTFGVPDQNNATGTYTYPGNRCRYPQNDLLTSVDDTYWMKLLTATRMALGINESWAGSRVSWDGSTESTDIGANKHIASLARIGHLGGNGTPDLIIVQAGTNDIAAGVTVGTFNTESPKDYTEAQIAALPVATFADAYRTMLIRLQYYYPASRIVVLFPDFVDSYYTMPSLDAYIEVIREACDYFGVEYVDLRAAGITIFNRATYLPDGIHPNAGGMELLYQKTYNHLISA